MLTGSILIENVFVRLFASFFLFDLSRFEFSDLSDKMYVIHIVHMKKVARINSPVNEGTKYDICLLWP
jgi:hypothetical protein